MEAGVLRKEQQSSVSAHTCSRFVHQAIADFMQIASSPMTRPAATCPYMIAVGDSFLPSGSDMTKGLLPSRAQLGPDHFYNVSGIPLIFSTNKVWGRMQSHQIYKTSNFDSLYDIRCDCTRDELGNPDNDETGDPQSHA